MTGETNTDNKPTNWIPEYKQIELLSDPFDASDNWFTISDIPVFRKGARGNDTPITVNGRTNDRKLACFYAMYYKYSSSQESEEQLEEYKKAMGKRKATQFVGVRTRERSMLVLMGNGKFCSLSLMVKFSDLLERINKADQRQSSSDVAS